MVFRIFHCKYLQILSQSCFIESKFISRLEKEINHDYIEQKLKSIGQKLGFFKVCKSACFDRRLFWHDTHLEDCISHPVPVKMYRKRPNESISATL